MSCGTRLYSHDDYELARNLEREGEYGLASQVRRGECLDSYDLRRAEHALERTGMQRDWDYKEERCHCSTDEDDREY